MAEPRSSQSASTKAGGIDVITCPSCNNENKETEKICVFCGFPLVDLTKVSSTKALDDTDYEEGTPRWGSARFNSRTNLIIGIEDEARTLLFDADEIEELVIGRKDPQTGDTPQINLDDYSGLEKGVSRRHAAIIHKDGSLSVMDMGSANGTFLNGQQLVPNQARVLRDGDDIRVGHLTMRVTFERRKQ